MKRENTLLGIMTILLYFVQSIYQLLPLQLIGIDYYELSLTARVCYSLLYEFIFILILLLIYNKRFKEDAINYIKNFKTYVKEYFKYWAIAFGLMIASNFVIVSLIPNATATNQEIVDSIFKMAPLYMFISAVIFAPFIEETLFRLSIRNIIKNDTLFIILSGLIFGSLHVVGSAQTLADFVYIIPYSIPGCVFAYTLVKSKNIFVPMGLHFFHNGFTIILQIIASILL